MDTQQEYTGARRAEGGHHCGAPGAARGVPLFAALVVLVIIAIAAVAAMVARQRGGAPWSAVAQTAEGTLPRCLLPGDEAYVSGAVTAYPGLPGFTPACYGQALAAPTSAGDVAGMGLDAKAAAACPAVSTGDLWYRGHGEYGCRPAATGGRDGFQPSNARPGCPADMVEFSGATRVVRTLLARAKCHPGHVPVLLEGTVDAYMDPMAHVPCGRAVITSPTPATTRNLRRLEEEASGSCSRRGGWFVVHAHGVCPDALRTAGAQSGGLTASTKEGFYWADWDENTERENYSGQRRRRREGFSPDAPGACSRCHQPGLRRAADLEAHAISVAMGN